MLRWFLKTKSDKTVKFSRAIVKKPCRNMIKGITNANLGLPDFDKALEQHRCYIDVLKSCGLEVIILEADEKYPDSVFIEDTAVVTSDFAVITMPGAESRKGEISSVGICLEKFFHEVERIELPGTLDGGDVMMTGDHFYIGLSERTNSDGAEQFISILEKNGRTGSAVNMNEVLHLKTGVSYLENNNLLAAGEFLSESIFDRFDIIEVPESESYAANSLWINGCVLVPSDFPETASLIQKAGYEVITVDVSEFRKLDGGLSCLSLRY